MSRLPDLERSLHEAAVRLEDDTVTRPSSRAPQRRLRRRGVPLALVGVGLVVAAGATAAGISGVLSQGSPVPTERHAGYASTGTLKPGSSIVLPLRAADPAGGPPWAIGVFALKSRATNLGTVAVPAGTETCVRLARVQNGRLGVVGRDDLFHNDGRFHPQPDLSSHAGVCSGLWPHGQLLRSAGGAPLPASAYTGAITTPIGGCLFNPLHPPVSAQTRRKLGHKPICPTADMRIVKYGFAGNLATRVRVANDRISRTMKTGPGGSYLFVMRATQVGKQPLTTTVTYRGGTVCTNPAHPRNNTTHNRCNPPPGF